MQLTSINRLGQMGGAHGRESVEYFAVLIQEFDLRVDGGGIPRLIVRLKTTLILFLCVRSLPCQRSMRVLVMTYILCSPTNDTF